MGELLRKFFHRAGRTTALPASTGQGDERSPIELYGASGRRLADASPRTQQILRLAEQTRRRQRQQHRLGPAGRHLTGEAAAHEAAMIRTSDDWPLRPWLPVKRYPASTPADPITQYGLVHAKDLAEHAAEVRVLGPRDPAAPWILSPTISPEQLPVFAVYDTVEELIADGWMAE
jgi:hypothetical protein